ncbi:MAG TPA: hypothetical protein VLH80_09630 [Nitrospiraceae bacterium]|nr:hypothetical protein [Nitrospiraceae bacterium]
MWTGFVRQRARPGVARERERAGFVQAEFVTRHQLFASDHSGSKPGAACTK